MSASKSDYKWQEEDIEKRGRRSDVTPVFSAHLKNKAADAKTALESFLLISDSERITLQHKTWQPTDNRSQTLTKSCK